MNFWITSVFCKENLRSLPDERALSLSEARFFKDTYQITTKEHVQQILHLVGNLKPISFSYNHMP